MSRRIDRRRGLALTASVVALALASCASSSHGDFVRVERWRVVNPSTDPPQAVGGAFVLVKYVGTAVSPGHSASICDRAILAKADHDGWFEVPITRERRDVQISAHKLNHAAPIRGFVADSKLRQAYLVPGAQHEQRIRHLGFLRGATGCAQIGENGKAIGDFAEMLIPEMRSLVRTDEDRLTLRLLEAVRDSHRARSR